MEETTKLLNSSKKSPKLGSNPVAAKLPMRSNQSQPLRVISNTHEKQGQRKEQTKSPKKHYLPKPLVKEKPVHKAEKTLVKEKPIYKAEKSFRLHSEERAMQRASYNYMVTSKINSLAIIRRFEEKILKVMEEEDIKTMRKEMVPKAQLMPHFDRPFYPQRSTRPLTRPKDPSFLKQNCCIGGEFHRHFCFNTKTIK